MHFFKNKEKKRNHSSCLNIKSPVPSSFLALRYNCILHYSKKQPEPKLKFKRKNRFCNSSKSFPKATRKDTTLLTGHEDKLRKAPPTPPPQSFPIHGIDFRPRWWHKSCTELSSSSARVQLIGTFALAYGGNLLRKVTLGKLCHATGRHRSIPHCHLDPVKHIHFPTVSSTLVNSKSNCQCFLNYYSYLSLTK